MSLNNFRLKSLKEKIEEETRELAKKQAEESNEEIKNQGRRKIKNKK